MYESLHDVEQKLYHTVILYDNKPVYVTKYGEFQPHDGSNMIPSLTLAPIPQATKKVSGQVLVTVQDPLLNFRGISSRLGYMNYSNDCIWLSRIAIRKSVQGLNQENLLIPYTQSIPRFNKPMAVNDFTDVTKSEGFSNMILSIYPELPFVKGMLDTNCTGVAFTRDFAITSRKETGSYQLEYKGVTIGETKNCKKFVLNKEFYYLGEILEHQGLDFTISAQATIAEAA